MKERKLSRLKYRIILFCEKEMEVSNDFNI